MASKLYFILLLTLMSCLPDFENPIDPSNEESIPPDINFETVKFIPGEQNSVYRGEFDFTWENTSGIELLIKSEDSTQVVDTLNSGALNFDWYVINKDTANYEFQLKAFNKNGFGTASKWVSVTSTDTLDLFPPEYKISYMNTEVYERWIVQESNPIYKIKIVEQSSLSTFRYDGVELKDSLIDDLVEVVDTLFNFRNFKIIELKDESLNEYHILDTLEVLYDFPNKPLLLDLDFSNSSKVNLLWNSDSSIDFAYYELSINGKVTLIENPIESRFETSLTWSDDFNIELKLVDSLENEVVGPYSKIISKNGKLFRGNMVWINENQFVDQNHFTAQISKGFWMDTTEVIQSEFTELMNFNSSIFRDPLNPVEAVNYSDAIVFANKRSKLNGLDTIYEYESIDGGNINGLKINSEIGFRLPYEDEWELAARGGIDSVAFLWLDTTDYIVVNEYLWFNQNAGSERTELPYALYPGSQKVASKKANEFGLYDMLGNVDEWTNNYWQSNEDRIDGRIDDKSPISCTGECLTIDSEVFENEYQRVVRGGHWALGLSENSLSARRPQSQSVRTRNTGFRLVINGREAE